jgi:DnaJ-class molecular chaperone
MAPGSIADEVPKTETCVRCRGYGQVPSGLDGDERIQCPDCSGTGSIADEFSVYEDGSETFSAWVKREVG